jgi:hypothetical protein
VLNGLDVQTAAQTMARRFAYEICLTNLGNLRYGTTFGGLRLDAIWGPVVFAGFEGAQTIGVTTTNGTLWLVHASYTPAALSDRFRLMSQSMSEWMFRLILVML